MVLYHLTVFYLSYLALNVIRSGISIDLAISIRYMLRYKKKNLIAALQCDHLICSQEGELYCDLAQCCGPRRRTGRPIELLHRGVRSRLKLHC